MIDELIMLSFVESLSTYYTSKSFIDMYNMYIVQYSSLPKKSFKSLMKKKACLKAIKWLITVFTRILTDILILLLWEIYSNNFYATCKSFIVFFDYWISVSQIDRWIDE